MKREKSFDRRTLMHDNLSMKMTCNYVSGDRAVVDVILPNGAVQTYRRFLSNKGERIYWQEKIHNGDWHNIFDGRAQELELAFLDLPSLRLDRPDDKLARRRVLQDAEARGYGWVIFNPAGTYEVFRSEEEQQARVRDMVKATGSCPVNGMLRVGNGDNLHWFI